MKNEPHENEPLTSAAVDYELRKRHTITVADEQGNVVLKAKADVVTVHLENRTLSDNPDPGLDVYPFHVVEGVVKFTAPVTLEITNPTHAAALRFVERKNGK